MRFVYDPTKSESNRDKHGVDFAFADRMWRDEAMTAVSAAHPVEQRFAATAQVEGKFWTAIYTPRGETIRIISIRRARKKEIAEYGADET